MMKKAVSVLVALIMLLTLSSAAYAERGELLELNNPTLTEWALARGALQLTCEKNGYPVDYDHCNGSILYYANDVRYGVNGEAVADAGAYSDQGSYILGAGAGIDRDDLWYVTMTYSGIDNQQMCEVNVMCMIYAFEDLYTLFTSS
ncbi:hypothetical protein RCJ22_39820, partial [Vibrio sp. FNV 38]|nr:hypothetical protein [Vibrio sp. FNV 38]